MREFFWVAAVLLVLVANLPWISFFGWVKEQRGKKYKSHDDVI